MKVHQAEAKLEVNGTLLVDLTLVGNDAVAATLAKSLLREVSREVSPGKLVIHLKIFPKKQQG